MALFNFFSNGSIRIPEIFRIQIHIQILIRCRWHKGIRKKKKTTSSRSPKTRPRNSFYQVLESESERLRRTGNFSTSANYRTALNSIRSFMSGKPLPLDGITPTLIKDYENWLHQKTISPNTASCYLRTLRAAYNKAADQGLIRQSHPFKKAYTGTEKKTGINRIGKSDIRKLETLKLQDASLQLARDLFIFSFLACGMPFVDLAYLKKEQIQAEYLTYRRHKTGKLVRVKLDERMLRIIQRYTSSTREHLFPILNNPTTPQQAYKQYHSSLCRQNRLLKQLAIMVDYPYPLSSYTARHAWASHAYEENVALATISKALGHTQARTTQAYIHETDNSALEKAQRLIIQKIFDYPKKKKKQKEYTSVQELNSQ